MGSVGLSLSDFCALTPGEWHEVCRCWRERHESVSRDAWERARWLGAVTVQPHVRKRLSPRDLLRLPWDEVAVRQDPRMSREERERRMADAIRRMGATFKE